MVIAALAAVAMSAQQAEPFRSRVELVSLDATVTDAHRLVTTLTQDDFTVLTTEGTAAHVLQQRDSPISVVVMLDRSGSMLEHFWLVRDATAEFVRRMLPLTARGSAISVADRSIRPSSRAITTP
jgi:hypothetical protein